MSSPKFPKVLMVATSSKTRGGITAVLNSYKSTFLWKKFHCRWVETHRDSNNVVKLRYLFFALLKFAAIAPFYDIIHIHFSLPSSAARKKLFLKIAKFYRKKTIIHYHFGAEINDFWNKDFEYLFKNADMALLLAQNLEPIIKNKVHSNIIYQTLYNPCINSGTSENRNNQKKKEILYAGTITSRKGYADLIKAFASIADQHPDWSLVIAGNGEIQQARQLASDFHIADRVQFPGWLRGQQMTDAFNRAAIFCLPSYAEGFPMAVLDAFAFGLPVITTPVGGIPDIAKDGENMLLFTPGDIPTLAHQLSRLISDESLRAHLSHQSSNFANTTFNITTTALQLDHLYTSLA